MNTYGPRDIYDQLWNAKGPMERQIEGGHDAWRARMIEQDATRNRQARKVSDEQAAELDAIAEGLRQSGDHEAADNLAEYGEYDYHGMARILNAYADRLAAVAQQLKH